MPKTLLATAAVAVASITAIWLYLQKNTTASMTPISTAVTAFPLEAVLALTPYGKDNPETELEHRYLLVVYFDNLSCSSCRNKVLPHLAQLHQELATNIGFLAVVKGIDFDVLGSLRRVGHIPYPILTDAHIPQLDMSFILSLVDLGTGDEVLHFGPNTGNVGYLPEWEAGLRKMIGLTSHATGD